MATIKQTIKYGMLQYPTLFPNPVDVLEHLFCVIGNGYDWVDGELVDHYYESNKTDAPLTMKYPKREEDVFVQEVCDDLEYLSGLRTEYNLRDEARLLQMRFVDTHINEILEASPTAVYFGDGPRGVYFIKGICPKYAKAFNFPEDIKEDWAKTLYKFLNYWLTALNHEYGVSQKADDLSWWPADVQEGRRAILDTRTRLHPYAHGGETYEQHVASTKEFFKTLVP